MTDPLSTLGAGLSADGTHDGFEVLARVEDVPEGTLLPARRSDGTPVCVFNCRGTIGAVRDECTHAEFPLSDGVLRHDGTIECIWHGARFDCATGAVRRGPATDAVETYPVRVEKGRVYVGRGATRESRGASEGESR